jgi:exodeoxyribonuclease VII small subunit
VKLKPQGKEVPFEDAMSRLEKIVDEMESGDLPLEEVLQKYEEGNRLVKLCAARLNEAEKRIEVLMKEKDGSLSLKPLDEPVDEEDEPAAAPPAKGRVGAKTAEGEGDLF